MKFGKEFTTHLEETLPEWRDKFLCYKPLKKFLKNFPIPGGDDLTTGNNVDNLQHWFVRILNEELEKFNDFFVDKEEEFVIRFQELKERIERLKEESNNGMAFTSESEFSEEMMDIRKDFVTIHGEMVLLKNYSSLNFAGLVKILKKYDKRTGGVLRLPFTQFALNQPSFLTEPLTRLVRDCEANLELLFPLEAEIVEAAHDRLQPPEGSGGSHAPSNLGAETMDIYRSTLAAMRAIRGLQKASSTHNPLSFSSLVRAREDEDGTGTVTTAENSASNSPAATLHGGGEEEDDEDSDSSV